jgi:hypothetical protein
MASKLEHALALAAAGFKVFPITPGAKAPPLVNGWPAQATDDSRQVLSWWGQWPDANIGIHCEGLLVVDVDIKKGGAESFGQLEDLLGLPYTQKHRTPTGGWHVIYRLPEGHPGVPNSVEALGKGLDVRSTNGYIVAPGSTVDAGEYTIMDQPGIAPAPAWLVQKLGAVQPKVPAKDVPDAPQEAVDRALTWLETAERSVKGAGGDQAAFRVACQLRDRGLSYGQACEAMRSDAWDLGCGWREGWLEEKPIASAYRYAQNEEGGTKAMATASMFPAAAPGVIKLAQIDNSQVIGPKQLDDIADEKPTGSYILKYMLERNSFAQIFGASGEGKTFVGLDIGYHVAANRPWFGKRVKGGPVLYLPYEGDVRNRMRALQKKLGHARGFPFYVDEACYNLREPVDQRRLGEAIAKLPQAPVLIIIDTFARAMMGADENSAQDVGLFIQAADTLRRDTGACVLVIHHSGKNRAAGARGSTALRGALDTSYEIDNKTIIVDKRKEGAGDETLRFKLTVVNVGVDDEGDALTSCIVEMDTAATSASSARLGGKGEHAFGVLCEMTGPQNTPVPKSRFVAKLKDEGFGNSVAYEWARRLVKIRKATVADDMISRRME